MKQPNETWDDYADRLRPREGGMTVGEFNTALADVLHEHKDDRERAHAYADDILVRALQQAGFSCDALTEYVQTAWWYA